MKRNFLIPKPDKIVIGFDFGQGEDVSVKTVFRIEDGRLGKILSSEVIGKATDFDTEEKIDKYIESL